MKGKSKSGFGSLNAQFFCYTFKEKKVDAT